MPIQDVLKGQRSNSVLRSLPSQNALLFNRWLRRVSLNPGDRLSPNETGLIYFPETLVLCLLGSGCNSALGMIGREGLVGWDQLVRYAQPAPQIFVALTGGSAMAISSDRLRALMSAQPELAMSLLPFLQNFAEQMGNTILATLHGSIEARLCVWLLMMHERIEGDELRITHGTLGALLNVRRASVTDTLHVLEGEKALCCTRGRVVVLDPIVLQTRAGLAKRGGKEKNHFGSPSYLVPEEARSTADTYHQGPLLAALG